MAAVACAGIRRVAGPAWSEDDADARARAIVASEADDGDKRLALLRLALEDPRLMRVLNAAGSRDDGDVNRALATLESKILDGRLCMKPLDLGRIAAGDSFSGWLYKTFRPIIVTAARKGSIRRMRETSIDMLSGADLDDGGRHPRMGAVRLGLAVEDDLAPSNPYRSIVMRRPMEDSYLRAERMMAASPGCGGVDHALDMLHREGWALSEETDRVDERLILSILMPRLSRGEMETLNREWPGLGSAMAASTWKEPKKRRRARRRVWRILDREAARTGMGSMAVWEQVTHRLFDQRWFCAR